MPNEYLIPRDLLEGVVRYLQTRPYAEVFQAVPALQSLKPAPVASDADEIVMLQAEIESLKEALELADEASRPRYDDDPTA